MESVREGDSPVFGHVRNPFGQSFAGKVGDLKPQLHQFVPGVVGKAVLFEGDLHPVKRKPSVLFLL